ncbi:glycosyltransferase [Bizionia sp. KMM 8389]
MVDRKHILVAPLNWGLGHATRCIPIIKALQAENFTPILASDGAALALLKNEFPNLTCLELPSYNIKYAKKGAFFKLKLLKDTPKILKNKYAEKAATDKILADYAITGIISDNRFGVYSDKVPSVFITHQLQVLSGNTTKISTKLHNNIIRKFDVCWVPDRPDTLNLSGKLGHIPNASSHIKYIGPLSRFEKKAEKHMYDILIILSGPEPQRSLLETKLRQELATYKGRILMVRGVIDGPITKVVSENFTIYNYLTSERLETALNTSALVISRSGYTTVMDLAKLNKKAFFIPTPGQFEQRYLAQRLHENGMIPYCKQADFTLDKLDTVSNFSGLQTCDYPVDFKALFSLFHTK